MVGLGDVVPWQKIERICQSALELEENQRTALLDRACGGNEESCRCEG